MRHDERLSAVITEMRARHDIALELRPPTDDVPDYIAGYFDALAMIHHVLTTNSEGTP